MREIVIITALNGFILKVGCQTIVFDDKAKMLEEISGYLADPGGTERRYLKDSINAKALRAGSIEDARIAMDFECDAPRGSRLGGLLEGTPLGDAIDRAHETYGRVASREAEECPQAEAPRDGCETGVDPDTV